MTGFPLEQGTCRLVCRPKRTRQRRVTISAVVRFARAAVRDGSQECDVVAAVVGELGCGPCQGLQRDVDEALDIAIETRNQLLEALNPLFDELDVRRTGSTSVGLVRRVLNRLKGLLGIVGLIQMLINVVGAAEDAEVVLGGVADVLALVSRCISDETEV